jgi:hypothetical protein
MKFWFLALDADLRSFARNDRPLPGIEAAVRRQAFVEQFLGSIRRTKFIAVLRTCDICDGRADPRDTIWQACPVRLLGQGGVTLARFTAALEKAAAGTG